MESSYREWLVSGRRIEAPGVVTLTLSGEASPFTPGQFVNVSLPDLGTGSKSYSIANGEGESVRALTIRVIGSFSSALCAKKEGDRVLLSEPIGYFYPPDASTPRIFVAGGIGVVPFMSVLRSENSENNAETVLLYSNRTPADTIFRDELESIEREKAYVRVRHFLTRSVENHKNDFLRRISASDLAEVNKDYPRANFFLCGSIPFVRDMRLHLKTAGVAEERIFTEAFF